MTTAQDISKAKAAARRRARKGDLTHQQALDAIAREKGHAHWGAMMADHEKTVVAEGSAEPLRGPSVLLPPALDDFPYLRAPGSPEGSSAAVYPGMETIGRDVARITERAAANQAALQVPALALSDWIAMRMKEPASQAGGPSGSARPSIKPIDVSGANIAYAMDPEHGPYDDHDRIMVRCPVHEDKAPSLLIHGERVRCLAGCDDNAIRNHLVDRLIGCAEQAVAFMIANDKSLVVEGHSNHSSQGGMGGTYRLQNKKVVHMETLVCRMLGDDYPKWDLGG